MRNDNENHNNAFDDNEDVHTRRRRTLVSFREFYTYRLMIRSEFSMIHNGGKLFQQYVVDAWCKIETNELWYLTQINNIFRMAKEKIIRLVYEQHQNRDRNVHNLETELQNIGRRIILPSSFIGSARHEYKIYQEAMSIVARHGKPDLFITFTCNLNRPEITKHLDVNQKACHRPDLVCRGLTLNFKIC